MLSNSNYPDVDIQLKDIQQAARVLRQQISVVNASNERDIDADIPAGCFQWRGIPQNGRSDIDSPDCALQSSETKRAHIPLN